MDALVTGIAVLAVIALTLRWANKDERSTSPGGAGRTTPTAGSCPARSRRRSAHSTTDTAARCNGRPVNTKRL